MKRLIPQCDLCDIPINNDEGLYCVFCSKDLEVAKGSIALEVQQKIDHLIEKLKKLGYTYERYNDRSSIRKDRKNG